MINRAALIHNTKHIIQGSLRGFTDAVWLVSFGPLPRPDDIISGETNMAFSAPSAGVCGTLCVQEMEKKRFDCAWNTDRCNSSVRIDSGECETGEGLPASGGRRDTASVSSFIAATQTLPPARETRSLHITSKTECSMKTWMCPWSTKSVIRVKKYIICIIISIISVLQSFVLSQKHWDWSL